MARITTPRAARARRRFLGLLGAGGAAAGLGLALPAAAATGPTVTFGNRIPKAWFWFQGLGVSEQGYGSNPYETFAYDLALAHGGIEDYNVVPYTSVLPRIAYGNVLMSAIQPDGTITRPDSVAVTPGSVLEVIMSQQGMAVPWGRAWTIATGLGMMWAAERDSPTVLRNGYAAEYEIHYESATPVETAEAAARQAIEKSLAHELEIRGLVPYRNDSDPSPNPTVVVLANQVQNPSDSGELYVTQITGIGCYAYVFPELAPG